MECSGCKTTNRPGARFCRGCGRPLVAACPSCGAANEPDAQFCDACGTSLASAASDAKARDVARDAAAGSVARKVGTIVFADMSGSTSLHERLDAESTRSLMERYYRVLHAAVEGHGGRVVKLLGDGVMAVFGVPRVAEDDAIRAVRAGVEMQWAFADLTREHASTAAI